VNATGKIAVFLIDLVVPMALGYALARAPRLKKEHFDLMMLWSIVLLTTPLALLSCWKVQPDWTLLWLPLLGVFMQVVPGAIGYWRMRRRFRSPLDSGAYVLSAMLSSRGTVGALVVVILYGETGYAYCRLIILLMPVVVYCFCFPMAGFFHARSIADFNARPSLLSLIFNVRQAPVLGVAAGLALALTGVPRPPLLGELFTWGFHPVIWMLTIPVGASLNLARVAMHVKEVADLIPLKFVVTPLAVAAAAWAVGLHGQPLMVTVILSACPTALIAVITCRLCRLNADLAMASLLTTTVLFVAVALPVLIVLL